MKSYSVHDGDTITKYQGFDRGIEDTNLIVVTSCEGEHEVWALEPVNLSDVGTHRRKVAIEVAMRGFREFLTAENDAGLSREIIGVYQKVS